MKQLYSLICDKCWSITGPLEVDAPDIDKIEIGEVDISVTGICPHCKKESYFFSVDENIAPAVAELNKFKYINTQYSCQGHSRMSYNNQLLTPYIKFSTKKPLPKKLIKAFKENDFCEVSVSYTDQKGYYRTKSVSIDDIDLIRSSKELTFYYYNEELIKSIEDPDNTYKSYYETFDTYTNALYKLACLSLADSISACRK